VAGAAYIFVREGTNWAQQAYLKASNTQSNDAFFAVAISGDTVIVGANREDSSATGVNGSQTDNSAIDSGAAYIYMRNGTNWSQQAYLKASNTGSSDRFGISVAISGDVAIVGADSESSNATGIDGAQHNNDAFAAGAAYAFVRVGTNWAQRAYLKASNAEGYDMFGGSVSVSAGTIGVGGFLEDSNSTGVNGNQNDNSFNNAGAGYVFAGLDVSPGVTISPDGSGGYFIRSIGVPGRVYSLHRAVEVTGPWGTDPIDEREADTNGEVELHDLSPPAGCAFYRTAPAP
jgi:hypothetical protein